MTLVRNKLCFLVFTFLIATNAAWSKSVAVYGIFTETGQINPEAWHTILAYSALLVPLDALLTLFTIYYVGKRLRRAKKPG